MARFKLDLLTPMLESGKYLCQNFSDFSNQFSLNDNSTNFLSKQGACYSFDESLSIHKNAEKQLTFSMLQKTFNEYFEWMENPFTNLLQIGSLILLTDKFNNTYLFIIKDIGYKFLENNIEYKYTCQDFFSYRFSRLGNGYTLQNNEGDSDFIGAKPIDWWIKEKIHKDCNIDYSYIETQYGLCIYDEQYWEDGVIINKIRKIGNFNSNQELVEWNNINNNINRNVIKILKYCNNNQYPNEAFILSLSNSNAKAALITAVDQIEYMINVYEFWDDINNKLINFYWVEPSKNDRYSGITYSPFDTVQDFSLNLSGDSLTTVLNVDSVTKNDEEITLIPEISPLFTQYIGSNEWEETTYQEGMFNKILEGDTVEYKWKYIEDEEQNTNSQFTLNTENIYAPIVDKIPDSETKLFFATEEESLNEWKEQYPSQIWKDDIYYKRILKEQTPTILDCLENISTLDNKICCKITNIDVEKWSRIPSDFIECEYIQTTGLEVFKLSDTFKENNIYDIEFSIPQEFIDKISIQESYDYHLFGYDNGHSNPNTHQCTIFGLYKDVGSTNYGFRGIIDGGAAVYGDLISDKCVLRFETGKPTMTVKIYDTQETVLEVLSQEANLEYDNGCFLGTTNDGGVGSGCPIRIYNVCCGNWLGVVGNYTLVPCYNKKTKQFGFYIPSEEQEENRFIACSDGAIGKLKYEDNSHIEVFDKLSFNTESKFYSVEFSGAITKKLNSIRYNFIKKQWFYDYKSYNPLFDPWLSVDEAVYIEIEKDNIEVINWLSITNFNYIQFKRLETISGVTYEVPLNKYVCMYELMSHPLDNQETYGLCLKTQLNDYKIKPYYNLLTFNKNTDSYIKFALDEIVFRYLDTAKLKFQVPGHIYTSLKHNKSIDLGFKFTNTMVSKLLLKYENAGGGSFYGYANGEDDDYRFFIAHNKNTYLDIGGNTSEDANRICIPETTGLKLNEVYNVEIGTYYIKFRKGTEDWSEEELDSTIIPDSVSLSKNVQLFGSYDYGTIYSIEVYDLIDDVETLVHNFKPYKLVNGEVGLVDLITNNFIEVNGAEVAGPVSDECVKEYEIYHEQELPYKIKNIEGNLKFSFLINYQEPKSNIDTINYEIKEYNINITQYSQTTEDDILFAKIADSCPWLENILINFDYFLDQKVLDSNEYHSLLNIFKNNLRIINGKLLYYSKEYFNALRQKTKIISDLLSKFDMIGAWIKNNIIDSYSLEGKIEPRNDFKELYNQTLKTNLTQNNKGLLINFNETISEYFNKYFKSQQRFLKNIYNFKNYFNQLNRYSNLIKYNYKITANNNNQLRGQNKDFYNILLSPGQWTLIDTDNMTNLNEFTIVAQQKGNTYEKINIVTQDNYRQFKIANRVEYKKIDKFYSNREYYQKDGEEYNLINREQLFSLYKSYTNTENYYYKGTTYTLLNPGDSDTSFSTPKSIFKDKFFIGNRVNFGLHNKFFSTTHSLNTDIGKQNTARCYITNLPITELYCKVSKEEGWDYKPLQYVGNTWDGSIDSSAFMSSINFAASLINPVTMAFSTFKLIAQAADKSSYINESYRRVDSKPKDEEEKAEGNSKETEEGLIFQLDNAGTPTCFLDGKLIRQDWKWNLRFQKGLCDYWELDNIGKEYNNDKYSKGNLEDCCAALFTSTKEWPENFDFSKYRNIDNKKIIPYDSNKLISEEEYKEYFSKIVTTYNYNGCKKYFKNLYWRYMKSSDILKKDTVYYKMHWDKICSNFSKKTKAPKKLNNDRISAIEFYFLKEYFEEFTVEKDISVKEYFKNEDTANTNSAFVHYTIDKKNYSIFVQEDFNRINLENAENDDNYISNDSYTMWYNKVTNEPFHWTEDTKFLQNYYYMSPITYSDPGNTYDDKKMYYYEDINGDWKQAYTLDQLKNKIEHSDEKYYFIKYNELIHSQWKDGSIEIYPVLQHIHINDDWSLSIKYIDSPQSIVVNNSNQTIIHENKSYTGEIKCEESWENIPFQSMSNGEFWFNNYQNTEDQDLFQECALIETQLTEYWNAAYNASLGCEYVIPEFWQPNANGTTNYFKNLLFTIQGNNIRLSSTLLPNVKKVNKAGQTESLYSFSYCPEENPDITKVSINSFQDNIAFFKAFDYINFNQNLFNINDWYVVDLGGKTSYYYVDDSSGMKWENFPNYILKTSPIYPEMSGNYVMLLRFLLSHYKQRSNTKYELLKKQQKALWYSLENQYSNILLHNNYTPKDIVNSEDVLFLSQQALKDMSQAERQYNITLLENKISNFRLNNYSSQELHIGDPIAIQADDYYHQYDNIYNILQSYLFISDISYKLREDSSLKLTVNNLKYQDKLIQSLVKLIR